MPKGEKPIRFLASLMLDNFFGAVTIRFEAGRPTHVETETRRLWRYCDLPEGVPTSLGSTGGSSAQCGNMPPCTSRSDSQLRRRRSGHERGRPSGAQDTGHVV
jgi:hypothetical protein